MLPIFGYGREQSLSAFAGQLERQAIVNEDVAMLARSERVVAGVHFVGDLIGQKLSRNSADQVQRAYLPRDGDWKRAGLTQFRAIRPFQRLFATGGSFSSATDVGRLSFDGRKMFA